MDSFGRTVSASSVALVGAQQRDLAEETPHDAVQAGSTSDTQTYSASAAGVNRRLKAAISKLDMACARRQARADRSLVMYDVEPELLGLPALSLQELHELDEMSSLPGTPTQPGLSGTASRPGTTPPSHLPARPASGGEFSRPNTSGRPTGAGSPMMSRPSTHSSQSDGVGHESHAPGKSTRNGRDSPLISKRELA